MELSILVYTHRYDFRFWVQKQVVVKNERNISMNGGLPSDVNFYLHWLL
jgi:hypothetical protein